MNTSSNLSRKRRDDGRCQRRGRLDRRCQLDQPHRRSGCRHRTGPWTTSSWISGDRSLHLHTSAAAAVPLQAGSHAVSSLVAELPIATPLGRARSLRVCLPNGPPVAQYLTAVEGTGAPTRASLLLAPRSWQPPGLFAGREHDIGTGGAEGRTERVELAMRSPELASSLPFRTAAIFDDAAACSSLQPLVPSATSLAAPSASSASPSGVGACAVFSRSPSHPRVTPPRIDHSPSEN